MTVRFLHLYLLSCNVYIAKAKYTQGRLYKMKRKHIYTGICLLIVFTLWTVLLHFVDVKAIGPMESTVGFATINGIFHKLTGVHITLYIITDWLGLVPVGFGFGFALLGLIQWISRKSIRQVDTSLLVLGGFYLVVLTVYLFFEQQVVNYRPVLIAGFLEASYPSSTTLLVLCVMPTAVIQLQHRIKSKRLRRFSRIVITAFVIFMVVGRLISGVHWFTDIVGGILLSAGLVMLYSGIIATK